MDARFSTPPRRRTVELPAWGTFRRFVDSLHGLVHGELTSSTELIARVSCLNDTEVCVFAKRTDQTMEYCNGAYCRMFSKRLHPQGKKSVEFLTPEVIRVSQASDQMLLSGCNHVEFEHSGLLFDGEAYLILTHKILALTTDEPLILGLSLPVQPLDGDDGSRSRLLRDRARAFAELSAGDQEIARLVCNGLTNQQIAEQAQLSVRGIEQKRRRILDHLRLHSTAELIKLMVRLQDRGLVNLGI